MPKNKKIELSELDLRKKYFEEKRSQKSIAKEFGVSQWFISQRMKKLGIASLPKDRFLSNQIHTLREDALDNVTTDVAWILGWLLSDGFVHKNENCFGCKVAIKDQSILEYIRKFFGYSGPILNSSTYLKKTNKTYKAKLLKISSSVLRSKLIEYGIKPTKSGAEEYLNCIKGEFLDRAFIRGVFEGDGSILIYPQRNSYCFQIVGTKELLLEIQKRLVMYVGIETTKLWCQNKKANHYMMRYTGRFQVLKICQWIYSNVGENRLERKYDKYKELEKICQ